jgi:hypothetical protein
MPSLRSVVGSEDRDPLRVETAAAFLALLYRTLRVMARAKTRIALYDS